MPKKEKPARSDGLISRWISKLLKGSHHHYTCFLPHDIGSFSNQILKLFYSGIKFDAEQMEIVQRLDKNAIVVYVTKYQSNFEYLFYYNRQRDKNLPFPQVGFDYRVYLWQPVSRILRILLAKLVYFFRHRTLPNPYDCGYLKQELINGRCGFLSLIGNKNFYRRFIKAEIDPIHYLINMQESIEQPIYLIPQLIFFSKTARRENPRLIDILLGPEDKPGKIRRLYILFKNPGKVFVEVSEPLNLKHYLQSAQIRYQSTEYQSLVLRRDLVVRLNRHRQSITGPIRKSREELKESILTSERFQRYMETYAKNRKMTIQEVHRKADGLIQEIAANYKPAFIKIAAAIVAWITRTMFDGVSTNHAVINEVKNMSQKGPLVLIPCHKSHIDYLVLDYVLYCNNLQVPHIAAGKNLSFWPMGPIFRSGGAFFLRRSFGGAVLYSRVFAEYIHKLLEEGYNVEQFIEGGRSRTGKLLMPKLGLLSILINAFKNGACEDMIIVPIYIGYDRIIEEKSYLHELGGGQKEPENFIQVIRARKFLKKRYGKIYIQFHEPISLNQLLSRYNQPLGQMTAKETNTLIRNLGYRVLNAINRVSVVTAHAVVASAILNFHKDTFSFGELLDVTKIYLKYLTVQNAKLADTLVFDRRRAIEQAIDSYSQRKFIERIEKGKKEQDAEAYFSINQDRRLHLEYYKNNCIAFFIPAAYTALAILQKASFRFSAPQLHDGYSFWQSFFKYEFAYNIDNGPGFNVRKTIKIFIDYGMVTPHQTLPDTYDVSPASVRKLKLFALFLKTFLESYWIVLNYFMRNPKNAAKSKDHLKKITNRGNRMFKRKEVDSKEALSKVSYQNAIDLFTGKGIKGTEDTEQIKIYAGAIQNALKHLQP